MEIAEHLDALRLQGALLADAADRAGLDAAVPPCPSWLVKDLLRHTGYVHRWAARHITEGTENVIDGSPEADILRAGARPGTARLVPRRACRAGRDPDHGRSGS